MIMVSVGTIDWHSVHPRTLKLMPVSETIVMAVTIIANKYPVCGGRFDID